jgi:hypothetical protein
MYVRATSLRGNEMGVVLQSVGGQVLEDYWVTRQQPVSSLRSAVTAPLLSPEVRGNKLLRVQVPSIEALQTVMDAYFDISESTPDPVQLSGVQADEPDAVDQGRGLTLDETAQAILGLLVAHLEIAQPGRPETYLGYKEIHEMLALPQIGPWGHSLKCQGLEAIAAWASGLGVPAITGIVVDAITLQPGAGYFELHSRREDDFSWWKDEIATCKSIDWTPFVAAANTPGLPCSVDLDPPARASVLVSRIIRDTVISQRVKKLHNFACQLCGHVVELSGGGRYAEAHHVKPLGAPHDGPDVLGNLVCVCPNHHAQLDFGAIKIDKNAMRMVRGHVVSEDFINYHNTIVIASCQRKDE